MPFYHAVVIRAETGEELFKTRGKPTIERARALGRWLAVNNYKHEHLIMDIVDSNDSYIETLKFSV